MNLWQYLLIHSKNKEKGFTIVLVLGFGLFMLAIGLTSIKMSSNSEVNSKIQEKSQQAAAAAELGLTRIQEVLDSNRVIAVYKDCVSRAADGTCQDKANGVASWANALDIKLGADSSSCSPAEAIPNQTEIEELISNTWKEADPNDPSKGQYRLLSYTYQTAGASQYELPGVAILEVEGRTNQFESGATGEDSVYNTGTTRLQLEIPIDKNVQTYKNGLPGLWMNFDTDATMTTASGSGFQRVAGSILIEDSACTGGGDPPTNITQNNIAAKPSPDPNPNDEWEVNASPQTMPDTPDLPPNNSLNQIQSWELFDAATTLPRTGKDVPYSDGAYHYLVPSLDNSGGGDIQIATGVDVVLYVQGPIVLKGNLNSGASDDAKHLQIYGNTNVDSGTGYQGTNWKYGCDDVISKTGTNQGQPNCPTQVIKLVGTTNIHAFVHAPDAWGCVVGGGSPNEVTSFTGALWIKQFTADENIAPASVDLGNCTARDSTVITLDTDSVPLDVVAFATTTYTEPKIAPLTSWRKVSRED